MALEEVQADEPGPAVHDDVRVRGDHEVGAGEVAPRAADEEGRAQQPRPHHDAPPGRRAQAPLPHDRLQADEGRRAGQKVAAIEYDPNRSAHRAAALRRRREVVHPRARGCASARARVRPERRHQAGQRLPLANIPTGTLVHAVELKPGQGARMARSAGSSIQLVAKDGDYGVLRLLGRAAPRPLRAGPRSGRSATRPRQPVGRQGRPQPLARQAADRPRLRHEPGRPPARRRRGQSKGGRHPVTPWGVPTLGKRTRRKHKESDKLIVRGRRRGRRGSASRCQLSKKGPFVEDRLSRIEAMNAAGEKRMIRTWSRASTIFPDMVGTRSRCTTAASTCPCS